MWCIQEINPEYRMRMYDVLNLYEEPYNPKRPVIGFDEKPKQLIEDSRKSIPMRKGMLEKHDYEYRRKGTANIFMAVEPKSGKRITQVTDRRTNKDFAYFLQILTEKYVDADCIRIVLDNLNTHTPKALYENLLPEQADQILGKIEFHYTPKHASWLNVAEIEIGIMDTQCTRRRIKNKDMLIKEVRAWTTKRNKQRKKINWTFTKQKADEKLGKYYTQ